MSFLSPLSPPLSLSALFLLISAPSRTGGRERHSRAGLGGVAGRAGRGYDYTVWPGILSNAGAPPPLTTGFALPPGQTLAVTVASAWSGRIWGRTLCSTDSSGTFSCATADCGSGAVECSGRGATPPATLAEFTLAGGTGGDDFYDVSLVDGYNLPMAGAARCAAELNAACPAYLRVGGGVACRSA